MLRLDGSAMTQTLDLSTPLLTIPSSLFYSPCLPVKATTQFLPFPHFPEGPCLAPGERGGRGGRRRFMSGCRLGLPLCGALTFALAGLALGPAGQAAPAGGKRVAVLIGVKEYDDRRLPNLAYTENDAVDLA